MIWILGLITGLSFDMPVWWWVVGFLLGMVSESTVESR